MVWRTKERCQKELAAAGLVSVGSWSHRSRRGDSAIEPVLLRRNGEPHHRDGATLDLGRREGSRARSAVDVVKVG